MLWMTGIFLVFHKVVSMVLTIKYLAGQLSALICSIE